MQKIGTESEKLSTEKEIAELKARLEKVDEWKKKKAEIEQELSKVWIEGGSVLEAPGYLQDAEEVEIYGGEDEEAEEVALSETETERGVERDDRGDAHDGYGTDTGTQGFVTPAETPMERISP